MIDLLDKINHLSAGIIWITKNLDPINNPQYVRVDYLLNGLLTQTINENSAFKTNLLFSDHFHDKLAVFVCRDFNKKEYLSFLQLIASDLQNQKNLLVIDDENFFSQLLENTPEDFKSALHLF